MTVMKVMWLQTSNTLKR